MSLPSSTPVTWAQPASHPAQYPYLPPRSGLPPSPTQPALGGPSRRPKRVIYFGIKQGRISGVYTSTTLAEVQLKDFPNACVRCFSTRYAAGAYVGGWDCKGKLVLPKGSPYPLFEYLLINYSTPPYLLSPLPRLRAAYQHARPTMDEFGALPSGTGIHPSPASSSDTLTHRDSAATLRPPMPRQRDSWRSSMVKSPSPLRHQVDESVAGPREDKAEGVGSMKGILAPPWSPEKKASGGVAGDIDTVSGKEKGKRGSIFGMPTFGRKQSAPAGKLLASPEITSLPESDDFAPPSPRQPLRPSRSSPELPRGSYQSSIQRPQSRLNPNPNPRPNPNRQSGLWSSPTSPLAESGPLRPSSQSSRSSFQAIPPPRTAPTLVNSDAPTFSRSAMRKSGIVMPASASSISRRPPTSPSVPGLSPSSSSSSISSMSSTSSNSSSGIYPSRLSGMPSTPLSDFAPPRAGFMRRPSSLSLSISSSSSSESVATITSHSTTDFDANAFDDGGYADSVLGIGSGKGIKVEGQQAKKEKGSGMMKGFGRMFGMKKKA